MYRLRLSPRPAAAFLALVVLATLPITVVAHETRDVGELQFVVGFLNEPAFEGQLNGVSVRISMPAEHDDHEHSDDGDGTAVGDEIDLTTHGALFTSPLVSDGGEFTFEIGRLLEELQIVYHSHPPGLDATIDVSEDAELSGVVEIQITTEGMSNSAITVKPDTTVIWVNQLGEPTVVMSGPVAGAAADPMPITESDSMVPVTGHGDDLSVRVTHVATGESRDMDLRERFGAPGQYISEFIPTATGAYEFHVTGTIDELTIDETFTSGRTTFDEVAPADSIQFPIALRSGRELQGAVEGVSDRVGQATLAAADADDSASTAAILGIAGIILGALGLAAGGGAIVLVSRRR